MARRSAGGVVMSERSLMPDSAMFRVRGIGVAVSVRVSTVVLSRFRFSFCFTPNFCSSSITSRPRSLKPTSLLSSLCVPISTSTRPSRAFCSVSRTSPCRRIEETTSTVTG